MRTVLYDPYDYVYGDSNTDDEPVATLAEDKLTQIDCPKCPLYRGGAKPYCARTGDRIRPEQLLPAICRSGVRINPI